MDPAMNRDQKKEYLAELKKRFEREKAEALASGAAQPVLTRLDLALMQTNKEIRELAEEKEEPDG